MKEVLITSLQTWKASKSERQKMQHAYIALTFCIVFLAGIVALFNANAGHITVLIAVITLGAFVLNSVVWNLLDSMVLSKISTKAKRK